MNKLLVIILLFFSSCGSIVSVKTAKNINKAENRIIKYNRGIQNQIERFPELIDNAYIIKQIDSILVKEDSIQLELLLNNQKNADSLKIKIIELQDSISKSVKELETIEVKDTISRRKLDLFIYKYKQYENKYNQLFNLYNNSIELNNQIGVIQDNNFIIDYKITDGKLIASIRNKEKYIPYEKTITKNNINIRKDFWKDKKFWFFFLIPLLVIIFFIGDKIKEIMQGFIKNIVKFVRKLIIKV